MHRTKELGVILFFLVCIIYIPSLFGGFVWDDEDFVYANTYVKEFRIDKFFTENAVSGRGKLSNYYRPIQFSLYAVVYKLAGLSPFAYHLAGILIHGASTLAVFLFLVKLTNSNRQAFFISLFFGLHPVQTESVSYISGLSDQLYTFFFFFSLILYLHREKNGFMLPLSAFFFVISLLSKELALVFPGILFALILYQKKYKMKNEFLFLVLVSGIAGIYLGLRFSVLQFAKPVDLWVENAYALHFTVRLGTFFHNFFLFLQILLFPITLHMERDYTVPIITSVFSSWSMLFFLINVVIIFFFKRFSHPLFKQALFFWFVFLLSLVPYTGIFLLNGIFYEHYLYLPMVFFWGFVVSVFSRLLHKKTVTYSFTFILILFVLRSLVRQWDWIDAERFYRQTLRFAPQSIRIINGLGIALAEKGNCKKAIQIYNKGLSLSPKTVNFFHNIANCYKDMGKLHKAEEYYKKAITTNVNFIFSYYSLLELYLNTNQKDKAKKFIKEMMLPRFPKDNTLIQLERSL